MTGQLDSCPWLSLNRVEGENLFSFSIVRVKAGSDPSSGFIEESGLKRQNQEKENGDETKREHPEDM